MCGHGTGEDLQQVQADVQAALPLGTHDPADPMGLEVSVTDKDAFWSLWQGPIGESQKRPLGFWSKLPHHLQTTLLPLRDSSWPANVP